MKSNVSGQYQYKLIVHHGKLLDRPIIQTILINPNNHSIELLDESIKASIEKSKEMRKKLLQSTESGVLLR